MQNKNISSNSLTRKKALIVGAGIGGLSLAALLAKKGFVVEVFEKNESLGGRARVFSEQGFLFDMGPSWYMMPEIFSEFFSLLGEKLSDYFSLTRLTPSYRIFFSGVPYPYDFYSDREKNAQVFESLEPGSSKKLNEYLDESARQYEISKKEFIHKNYDSIFDLFNFRVMREGRKLEIFNSMERIVNRIFTHPMLRKALQFHMLLLGTAPKDAPGIYRMMNHVDYDLGIWYPDKGMYELPKAIATVAEKNGAIFHYNTPVKKIIVENGNAVGIELENGTKVYGDYVISNADLHYTDTQLLDPKYAERTEEKWNKKILAPSALIMYLGVGKQFSNLKHHNLFFSEDWKQNFKDITEVPQFPHEPSLYVCAPSKTDTHVAPLGKENLFVLVPIPAGLAYDDAQLEIWSEKVFDILEKEMHLDGLREAIEYKRIYCVKDFAMDYNSYKGSALGLAHTLTQSAFWRPNNISKKVKNLFYVGANTNPGIGMPMCVISAQTAYKRIVGITDSSPLTGL